MIFSSIEFLIFFIVVISTTYLSDRFFNRRCREVILLLASYFFYAYWNWKFCFLLLFLTVSAYYTAKFIDNKWIFQIGIIVPLAVLGFFKYFNFFLDSFCSIIGTNNSVLNIILPVGISFYTFQAISYIVDVYRKKIPVENDFINLALYISFFPQLVAGPIVRSSDFLVQLREERKIQWDNICWGMQVFAFGLFKKIVLADHLSVFVDDVFENPKIFDWKTLILASVSYSFQIYFDFSGYSDMAIGCAKCFGYDFNRNFNLPYISRNITEFWRRWHISLSSWLRDYLYIPLGGNKKGKIRQYINLVVTMTLGGLWHGADWTFVLWGLIHGIVLCLDKMIMGNKHNNSKGVASFLGSVITFLFVTLMWILFRADSFSTAWIIVKGMFLMQKGIKQPFVWSFVSLILFAICVICAKRKKSSSSNLTEGYYPILNLNSVFGLTVFFVELGLILGLAYTGNNPFVYFQF